MSSKFKFLKSCRRTLTALLTIALFISSMPLIPTVAEAATIFTTANVTVDKNTPFLSSSINLGSFTGLSVSINYNAELLDQGDSFVYGWTDSSGEQVLGTVSGKNENNGQSAGTDETGNSTKTFSVGTGITSGALFVRVTSNTSAPDDQVVVVTLSLQGSEPELNPNITLCHATEAEKNPYNLLTTDAKSIVNKPNGHNEHVDGGLDDVGDIIPPFTYNFDGSGLVNYPGLNWSREYTNGLTGEEIYNGGLCNGFPLDLEADVTITKTVSTSTPFEGGMVTYTLRVTNTGADSATGVVVNDPLPTGLTYQSASINPTTNAPLSWNIGTLAVNEVWMVTITALVGNDQGGRSLTNTAYATSTVLDPNPNNNNSSVTINPVDVMVAVPGCTDPKAINHNVTANQDDGSCRYAVTVNKVVLATVSPDYTAFSFTVDGGATTTFGVTGTNFIEVSSSTHTILEVPVAGYTTTYDNCVDMTVTSGTAVCTITNTPVAETTYGTLVVRKVVEGESEFDFTSFSFMVNGGATTTFEQDGTNELHLPVGAYTIIENTATGYATTYTNCENVAISEAATTTCTITNTKNTGPDPVCTVNVVSDTSDFVVEKGAFAKALSFVHPAWTALITDATWIWGDNPVMNPSTEETQTFRKQFGFIGTVSEAKLYVASDNSHRVTFNASSTGSDVAENNFQLATQDVYDVTSLVAQGNNELSIAVRNWAGSANPAANPAGLLYKLVISGKPTTDADCSAPYTPPTPETDTYRIQGYVWHDDNENTEWDGREVEEQVQLLENSLSGWTVNVTNGTSSFSTTTDEFGFYYFDVPAGTWTITEVVQSGWKRTTEESYVVTVPQVLVTGFFESIFNRIVPTAHAALLATYGDYNFGNDTVTVTISPTTSGGGGLGNSSRPRPQVLGVTATPQPTPQVLGEQVSVVPIGAPDTGRGGSAQPQNDRSILVQLLLARREDSQI